MRWLYFLLVLLLIQLHGCGPDRRDSSERGGSGNGGGFACGQTEAQCTANDDCCNGFSCANFQCWETAGGATGEGEGEAGGGVGPGEGEGEAGGEQGGEGEGEAGGGNGGGEGEGEGPSGGPTGPTVDPGCIDGQFSEPLPNPNADLGDLEASFPGAGVNDWILDVLGARYATGRHLVAGGLTNTRQGNCIDRFLGNKGRASDIYGQLSTIVHECGHFFDMKEMMSDVYEINEDVRFECSNGDTTDRFGRTFARSLINGDPYSALRPPCQGFGGGSGCDSYAPIYLDGDPTDSSFEGGDQGYNTVIEEAVQYVNSLATGYAFADKLGGFGVSERDGILTLLWWTERYLRLARLEYPDAYALIVDDPCWRRATLTMWGRAWLYLGLTEDHGNLGIDDDALYELVIDPDLLGEIQRLRDAEGCSAAPG